MKNEFTIKAAMLLAIFESTLVSTAIDDSRPVLQCTRIKSKGMGTAATIEFITADGFRMTIAKWENPDRHFGEYDGLIDRPSIENAVSALKAMKKKERDTTDVHVTETGLHIPNRGRTQLNQLKDHNFPKYEKLVPPNKRVKASKLGMNARFVKDFMTVTDRYSPSGIVRWFGAETPSSPMRWEWQIAGELTVTYVLMPMFVQW